MERSAGVRVAIAYPSDPAGTIPGGIETFIRGIINWAPAGFSFDVIGVTTDPAARPVGQWTTVNLGRGSYRSLPLFAIGEPGKQSRFPASLNHLLRLIPKRGWLRRDYDVIDMHRIEPAALFSGRDIALNAFFHQNMDVLRDAGADIRWRHLPGLYFWIEGLLMKRLSSVYAVREDAVAAFRERYASMADKFRFTPTWYDPDRFAPVSIEEKQRLRQERLAPLGVDSDDVVITSLGRLDKQKDPLLLLEAFARVRKTRSNARLLMIGDGVLRSAIEERIGALDLRQAVILAGLVNPADVADYLRASDLFALSSAYEGMPMCVLEALGCGVPVVTTRVGEVARVVHDGVSGYIVGDRSAESFADAAERALAALPAMTGEASVTAASDYVPARVLEPVFDNYRRIASHGRQQSRHMKEGEA